VKIDSGQVEEAAKELYIRALKQLPPDIKSGFAAIAKRESDPRAQRVIGTMIQNIRVAEDTDNLLCQDTGIPIYNIRIGRSVEVDGFELKAAIRRGCERATREYPLRSSVVHPVTRKNEQTGLRSQRARDHDRLHRESRYARDRDDPEGIGLGK
jgi:fumarate hydratase subunit alpha/L(+)-tartrate dehydratase alpha subunit